MWRLLGLCLCLASSSVAAAEAQSGTAPALSAEEVSWIRANPVLRIVVDPQQAPATYGGPRGYRGPVLDYLDLVAERSGVRLELIQARSWDEALQTLLSGKAELLPLLLATDHQVSALEDSLLFSEPIYRGTTLIITRTQESVVLDLDQLAGRSVAFKRGGAYDRWLELNRPEIRRMPLADVRSVLAAVESGRADAAIGVDAVYHPLLRRDYHRSLHVAGSIAELPVSIRVAVRADNARLLQILDKSLASISAEDHARLLERWIDAVYRGKPTLASLARHFATELALGMLLVMALLLALVQMRRAQLASRHKEQQKAAFAAFLSHEVGNQVNAIASAVELLARSPLPASQQRLAAIAQAASSSLLALLRNALDYARMEAGKLVAPPAPCDVVGVACECLDAVRADLDGKGLEGKLLLPGGPLPWLLVDAVSLRQLLINLLSNAVKFTDSGQVDVVLRHAASSLRVEVRDTGIGISAQRQRQLFQPFAPADPDRSRRRAGAGLGLAICRDMVEQLGGRIWIKSAAGVGTTVGIELPTEPTTAPIAEAWVEEHGSLVEPNHDRPRLLLVEDHPASQRTIEEQLRFLGLDCTTVASGRNALAALAHGGFTAVLLDCELPDLDGYEVARRWRRIEAEKGLAPVPVIAISANTGDAHLSRCLQNGIDEVACKPLSLDRLRKLLARLEIQSAMTATALPALSAFSTAGLRDMFLTTAGEDLAVLRAAIEHDDANTVMRRAHRIKGGALMAGQQDIAALCGRIAEEAQGSDLRVCLPRLVAELDSAVHALFASNSDAAR